MFDIVKRDKGTVIIYRSNMLKAAKAAMQTDDKSVIKVALSEIDTMFDEMFLAFSSGNIVSLHFYKAPGRPQLDFQDIFHFKEWLVRYQLDDAACQVLKRLREYCKKKNIQIPKLFIAFGEYYENAIFNTDMYFNNTYDKKWLEDDLIKKAIKVMIIKIWKK